MSLQYEFKQNEMTSLEFLNQTPLLNWLDMLIDSERLMKHFDADVACACFISNYQCVTL
jgi:hypothetical protein